MKLQTFALAMALVSLIGTLATVPAQAQDNKVAPGAAPGTQPPAPTPVDPEREKSIRELLSLQQSAKAIQESGRRMIAQFRQSRPDIPADFWTRFSSKLEKVDDIVTDLVRLYAQRYTKEDVDGLIAFFKTPLGQKFATENSNIQQDLSALTEQWSQKMGQETAKEMAEARKSSEKPFDKTPFKSSGKVVTTKSGLQYDDMTVGTGAEAVTGKTAVVHYTGTLLDGKKFDSSRDRGESFDFPLGAGRVIKGWDEGVAGMKVGGRRKLIIPAKLGYGPQGTPGGPIPPNATLVFDVELMDVR